MVSRSVPLPHYPRHYPYRFGLRVLRKLPQLMAGATRTFPDPPAGFDPLKCYMAQDFDDFWDDASFRDVLIYLRGNKSLNIPQAWREHLLP